MISLSGSFSPACHPSPTLVVALSCRSQLKSRHTLICRPRSCICKSLPLTPGSVIPWLSKSSTRHPLSPPCNICQVPIITVSLISPCFCTILAIFHPFPPWYGFWCFAITCPIDSLTESRPLPFIAVFAYRLGQPAARQLAIAARCRRRLSSVGVILNRRAPLFFFGVSSWSAHSSVPSDFCGACQ